MNNFFHEVVVVVVVSASGAAVVVEVAGSVVVLVFVVVDVVLVVVVFAAVVVVGFTEVVVGVVDVELSDLIVMFLLRSKALRSRSGSTALVFKTWVEKKSLRIEDSVAVAAVNTLGVVVKIVSSDAVGVGSNATVVLFSSLNVMPPEVLRVKLGLLVPTLVLCLKFLGVLFGAWSESPWLF